MVPQSMLQRCAARCDAAPGILRKCGFLHCGNCAGQPMFWHAVCTFPQLAVILFFSPSVYNMCSDLCKYRASNYGTFLAEPIGAHIYHVHMHKHSTCAVCVCVADGLGVRIPF